MSVRYEYADGGLLIDMWDARRVMSRRMVVVLGVTGSFVLAALWAGFLYLKPWELNVSHHRAKSLLVALVLFKLSSALVRTLRGEWIGTREQVELNGSKMIYRRFGRLGVRLEDTFDIDDVAAIAVETSWISFVYRGHRHTIGYPLSGQERVEVARRILEHSERAAYRLALGVREAAATDSA